MKLSLRSRLPRLRSSTRVRNGHRAGPTSTTEWVQVATAHEDEIAPDDPLVAYFVKNPDVVDVERITIVSPALDALRAAGVRLVVPLVSQGELMGLLNLGPRLSDQDYSADDRRLLNMLSSQAATAVRVAQLVHQQQVEAVARERIEHELRVARLIQQTLIPKELPQLPGWRMTSHYEPAEAVGGDFFDFMLLEDGRLAFFVGDVTDKGMPAALVMATTRSLLRSVVRQLVAPGEVLSRVNDLLEPDIPAHMFVTCLYAVLDPASGRLRFANAGYNLPYRRGAAGVDELRATGMPLGMIPGIEYEESETVIAPGETLLFYSDAIVEAHNGGGDMFSFPRLQALVSRYGNSERRLVDAVLAELRVFTGPKWAQEDDVTLVAIRRREGE